MRSHRNLTSSTCVSHVRDEASDRRTCGSAIPHCTTSHRTCSIRPHAAAAIHLLTDQDVMFPEIVTEILERERATSWAIGRDGASSDDRAGRSRQARPREPAPDQAPMASRCRSISYARSWRRFRRRASSRPTARRKRPAWPASRRRVPCRGVSRRAARPTADRLRRAALRRRRPRSAGRARSARSARSARRSRSATGRIPS